MKRSIFTLTILLLLQNVFPSFAGGIAANSRLQDLNSAQWSVIAYGQGQTPTNSSYTITWAVNTGTAYNFFAFRNSGSLTVSGFNVDITQVPVGGSGKPNNTTFDLCQNGVWNSSTNTCSGTKVTVGTATDLVYLLTFSNLNLAAGSELSMRASTPPNIKNTYTTTLSVAVDRAHVRNGIMVNS